MAYLSLYRKWRPQRFGDVVGQEHVVTTVRNALNTGRTSHAYLFAGPRGTGKTTLARLLAKGLNCESGPTGDPCGECENCLRIARGHSVDVIEIDGASNRGIDEIRDVREKVKFAPAEGRYKVYIIDEVHMLTQEAFNALLKVLEEPPEHVVFLFATTEPHRIPATILSRCQKFDFHAFSPGDLVEQLRTIAAREGVSVDDGALNLIARHSDGGMRDALGYLDQCIAFASDTVTESLAAQVLGVVERERLDELAVGIAERNVGRSLALIKEVLDSGRDLRQFAKDAVHYFRDLLLLRAAPESDTLVALAPWEKERAKEMAERFDVPFLLRVLEGLGRAESDMRWAQSAQLPLEMAIIELAQAREEGAGTGEGGERLAKLEARIARLEAHLSRERKVAAESRSRPHRVEQEKPPERGERGERVEHPAAESSSQPFGEQNEETGHAANTYERGEEAWQPAGAGPGDPFLEKVQKRWPEFLEHLRATRHVQQEAFLREGTPGWFEEETLVVFFSTSHRFHQANMEHERNRSLVEQALRKFFGREIKLKSVLGDPPQSPAPAESLPAASEAPPVESRPSPPKEQKRAEPSSPPSSELPEEFDEPILRAALKLFGGTITKLERKENDAP